MVIFNQLTWLIAQDFINFSHRESFRAYTEEKLSISIYNIDVQKYNVGQLCSTLTVPKKEHGTSETLRNLTYEHHMQNTTIAVF
jgi:hypothetical protein